MELDRAACVDRFDRGRRRTRELFDTVTPDAYTARPIPLRNPICFYEGHLPAFNVNTLVKRGLGEQGIDAGFEILFERGIDPEDETAAGTGLSRWPARAAIQEYAERADRAVREALLEKDVARESNPVLRRGLAVFTILEHEPMHQETLRYMWHRLPYEKKLRPSGTPDPVVDGEVPARETVRIPPGTATLGADPDRIAFAWDNELPAHAVSVPEFEIDLHDVTNADYLEFVEEGARPPLFWERREAAWFWRGMYELVRLPMSWPVYVTAEEASAYARWKGRRLPTEAEYHRAAFGAPDGSERPYPWGEEPPDAARGNFDFANPDPVPVGSFPAGRSAWGIHDLIGNGWEWTSTVFSAFPGFEPMPSYPVYSTDFFDGRHFVLKGASPATARELVRRSFRNWFRGNYPYVYATFRCARGSKD